MTGNISIRRIAHNIFTYAFAIALVLDCRVMFTYLENTPTWWYRALLVFMIISITGCIFTERTIRKKTLSQSVSSIIMIEIYLFFYVLIQSYARDVTLLRAIAIAFIILYVYLFCKNDGCLEVLNKYRNLICIIGAASLVVWLFGFVLNLLPGSSYVMTSWTGTDDYKPVESYFELFFSKGDIDLFGVTFCKNTSIFTEAPMASLNFSFALLIDLISSSKNEKREKVKNIILVASVISTFSFTGFVFVAALFVLKYMVSGQKNKLTKLIKIVLVPILGIVVLNFAYQLFQQKLTVSSGIIRLDDYVVCFEAWKTKKVFGAGIGNNDYLKKFMGTWRLYNQGLSNSPGQILAQGGIYIFALYMVLIGQSFYYAIKRKDAYALIFLILLCYLFIFTACAYQNIIFLFIAWLLRRRFVCSKSKTWKVAITT